MAVILCIYPSTTTASHTADTGKSWNEWVLPGSVSLLRCLTFVQFHSLSKLLLPDPQPIPTTTVGLLGPEATYAQSDTQHSTAGGLLEAVRKHPVGMDSKLTLALSSSPSHSTPTLKKVLIIALLFFWGPGSLSQNSEKSLQAFFEGSVLWILLSTQIKFLRS